MTTHRIKDIETALRAARAVGRAADRATMAADALGDSQAVAISAEMHHMSERLVRQLMALEALERRERQGARQWPR